MNVADSDGRSLLRTVIKVPAGNCRAISDTCKSCCSSCSGGEHDRLRTTIMILAALRVHTDGHMCVCVAGNGPFITGGSMTMSGPKGNPAYKWVEVWYDDWDTLKVKYAHAHAAGTPHETHPAS